MVDPGLPVVGEQAVFSDDALGYLLRQVGAKHLKPVFLADALVPAAQEEAGIVDVMVEVVVSEKEVVDLGGKQSRFDQLVSGGRAAVEHEELVAQFEHVGAAKPCGSRSGRSGAQGVNLRHFYPLGVACSWCSCCGYGRFRKSSLPGITLGGKLQQAHPPVHLLPRMYRHPPHDAAAGGRDHQLHFHGLD